MSAFYQFAKSHPELPYEHNGQGNCFSTVIACLKLTPDHKWAREMWNGKGMFISLQVPDPDSKMGRPYIFMVDAQGLRVPWLASQTDMLACDWVEVF